MARYAMVIDLNRCIGCTSCAVACKMHNAIPPGLWWRRVDSFGTELHPIASGEYPNKLHISYLTIACMHCDNPPCVNVCPVGASFKREDGLVLIDYERCIGCRYCMIACPYNARRFLFEPPEEHLTVVNPEAPIRRHGVVMKCEFCVWKIDRERAEGKDPKPVCVEACPYNALIFGNLKDPNSEVSKILRTSKVITLRANLGTNPKVKYKL